MEIIDSVNDFWKIPAGCVLTIGNFDGVHLGHRQILLTAKNAAKRKKVPLAALTFEPHPVAILYPEKAPKVLTALSFKQYLLERCGVDYLIVIRDSAELLSLLPEQFVDDFLMKYIKPSVIVEGDNFNFGADRAGNIDTLKEFGKVKGFEVKIVEAKEVRLSTGQSVRASSTMIRYMLTSGNAADAACTLGYHYKLIGKVIRGRGVARKLGFPTLNMEKTNQVIPAEGVYCGFAAIADSYEDSFVKQELIPAVYSIGQARTYGDSHPLLIEAHLLEGEWEGDYYGKFIALDFIEQIRQQLKFASPAELSAQIVKDCEAAKRILAALFVK